MKFSVEISKRAVTRIRRAFASMDYVFDPDSPEEVIRELFVVYGDRSGIDADEREHVKVRVERW